MPTYEYVCTCGEIKAKLRKISERDDPIFCDVHPKTPMTRGVGNAGFILKGGAWYKDHYGLRPSEKKEA